MPLNFNINDLINSYVHLIQKKLEFFPEESYSAKIFNMISNQTIKPEKLELKGYGFKVLERYDKRTDYKALKLRSPEDFYGNIEARNEPYFNSNMQINYISADLYIMHEYLSLDLQSIIDSYNIPTPYTQHKIPVDNILKEKINKDTTILVDSWWSTKIYILYRLITNGQVVINGLQLGSNAPHTSINASVSNRQWTLASNDPIVSFMDAVQAMKNRDPAFRRMMFKPKFIMNFNTFKTFWNNANVREYFKYFDISSLENLFDFQEVDVNSPVNRILLLGKNIEILLINDQIINPNNNSFEEAIPDNKVFVFYDISNNVKFYHMIPPYIDERGKIVMKSGDFEFKQVMPNKPFNGIYEFEFLSGMSALILEQLAFSYFDIS